MIIYKCDKCKKEFDYVPDPIGDAEYKYQISKFNNGVFSSIHVCKDCETDLNDILDEFFDEN